MRSARPLPLPVFLELDLHTTPIRRQPGHSCMAASQQLVPSLDLVLRQPRASGQVAEQHVMGRFLILQQSFDRSVLHALQRVRTDNTGRALGDQPLSDATSQRVQAFDPSGLDRKPAASCGQSTFKEVPGPFPAL